MKESSGAVLAFTCQMFERARGLSANQIRGINTHLAFALPTGPHNSQLTFIAFSRMESMVQAELDCSGPIPGQSWVSTRSLMLCTW